jgi:hypothetical protein
VDIIATQDLFKGVQGAKIVFIPGPDLVLKAVTNSKQHFMIDNNT